MSFFGGSGDDKKKETENTENQEDSESDVIFNYFSPFK